MFVYTFWANQNRISVLKDSLARTATVYPIALGRWISVFSKGDCNPNWVRFHPYAHRDPSNPHPVQISEITFSENGVVISKAIMSAAVASNPNGNNFLDPTSHTASLAIDGDVLSIVFLLSDGGDGNNVIDRLGPTSCQLVHTTRPSRWNQLVWTRWDMRVFTLQSKQSAEPRAVPKRGYRIQLVILENHWTSSFL